MKHNTPRQNKNSLKHFDLSEYRQILSDLAIQIYHQFIIVMENNIQHMIGKTIAIQEHLNVACEAYWESSYREAEGGTDFFLLIFIVRWSYTCVSTHTNFTESYIPRLFPQNFLV